MRTGISITLKPADRRRLKALARDRNTPHKHVWRAEIVLLSADGVGTNEIMRRTGKSKTCVWRWQERFMEAGYDSLLQDKTRPSRIPPLASGVTERVVTLTQTAPPTEATHWTSAMMAKVVGISASSVQRIWRAHGLQPHRVKQFKLSTDPRFVDKLRDVVGLYVDPPAHAVVLSVDEKSQIQALDRTQPGLPMKKGRAGTMTHDYKRHGTTTCSRPSTSSTAPSSAAICSATGTRSSFASSTPSRRRCQRESKSTPSSTTTQPTSIRRYANGWPGIPAGPSTSRPHRHPGSTPSRASSPSSQSGD
jgi:transposase